MRTIQSILLVVLLLPLAAQTTRQSKSAPPKPAAARPADPAPATPPASAQQVDTTTFHWKDAKGETWIYKKTPFGWSKIREKELNSFKRTEEQPAAIEVREVRGDEVTFEKPTPFSTSRWTKKKDAFSTEESAAYNRWAARASESGRTATAEKE
jgi:hypothetical protein